MSLETMQAAVAILKEQQMQATLEYPGAIRVERGGWVYWFGNSNENFGGDAYRNQQAYDEGESPEVIETPLPSGSGSAADIAGAVAEAIARHQSPGLYFVFNETDGVFCSPEPMTRAECDLFMIAFRERFAKQGYYASVNGRIPVSELRLKRIPEAEALC